MALTIFTPQKRSGTPMEEMMRLKQRSCTALESWYEAALDMKYQPGKAKTWRTVSLGSISQSFYYRD